MGNYKRFIHLPNPTGLRTDRFKKKFENLISKFAISLFMGYYPLLKH